MDAPHANTPEAYVLAFDSTHAAMAAASALDGARVAYAMIPTPRSISAGCGMALRFAPQVLAQVKALVDLARAPDGAAAGIGGLYAMNGQECALVEP